MLWYSVITIVSIALGLLCVKLFDKYYSDDLLAGLFLFLGSIFFGLSIGMLTGILLPLIK
jgi:hypothetical protein